jgi:hypothetical protein
MNVIQDKTFDEERALYGVRDTLVKNCTFAGEADGESVLKETRDVVIEDCRFSLRYPIWHAKKYELTNSVLDEKTRAPLWYSNGGVIKDTKISSVKALRECCDTVISGCEFDSAEFGWKTENTKISDSKIVSEYIFFDAKNVSLERVEYSGKYSFQYVDGLEINDCVLDTKDAFWHSKNVTVRNSVVKGEYLAWFSDGLTLVNCKIIGTQPLCYCKNLTLIDCEMQECDLSFEYSDVQASINGHIDSVKNPRSGSITADSIGEVIWEDAVMPCDAQVIVRK